MNVTTTISPVPCNSIYCKYVVNNFEYVYIICLFLVFLILITSLILSSIGCLNKIWVDSLPKGNTDKIIININYLKLISMFFILIFWGLFGRIFFQIFNIHGETEYIIAFLFVFGIVIIEILKKILIFSVLMFSNKLNFEYYYRFKNGHEGTPVGVGFYHVTLLKREDEVYCNIPNVDFLEKNKYFFFKMDKKGVV